MLLNSIKTIIKRIPVVGVLARKVHRLWLHTRFQNSSTYWEQRYAKGGNSGDGSYGALAEFKADFLKRFIERTNMQSFIEFGCGDGNQLNLIPYPKYIGLDISPTIIERNRAKFTDQSRQFFVFDPATHRQNKALTASQVGLSLDVIFHLTEDEIFETYMENLFLSASDYVIIYSSDTDEDIYPNFPHIKARAFSKWIAQHAQAWELIEHVPNPHPYDPQTQSGSYCDFFVYRRRQ
jgi:SAM-dependent methyltransferase